jgi:ribosomal protein L11 methylase PrmA
MKAATDGHPSSFRDPSGFLFIENGTLFRSVSRLYQQNYDHLIESGLYDRLVADELLIPHKEVRPSVEVPGTCEALGQADNPYKILQPDIVPFISYPYEWCFSQWKDAAIATLKIQKQALDCNMSLKDASAYNIQFFQGKPFLIDTLSFEIYKENQPWVAYRQFCQHFLAPLALMAYRDIRLGQLMRTYIDGLPLDLVSRLLPISTRINPALLMHIHLHAKWQKRYEKSGAMPISKPFDTPGATPAIPAKAGIHNKSKRKVSKNSLISLIHHLESAIHSMQWKFADTGWTNYYEDTNYSPEAMTHKKKLVETYLNEISPRTVWDLGANTGVFSRISAAKEIDTIAFDADHAAVEKNYRHMQGNKEKNILPLYLDLNNPSPSIGWANEERLSLIERGPADTVLALALIHHLTISNNVPFSHSVAFLKQLCRFLIIEFVPKDDSQVQRLLRTREDIFYNYRQDHFEASFNDHFSIIKHEKITDTHRTIYLMRKRNAN